MIGTDPLHKSFRKTILAIINDILDLSKIDVGRLDIQIQRVELEPILKGVLSTAVGLVGGKPIKLNRKTPKTIPDVKGDPTRIRQVLLNIYSNAAKFTLEGSIKLSLTYDDEMIKISIQDTGEGIHPDDLEKIFEEFRQGSAGRKKARAGAGLGMAISRQLLDLMGGRIWVESNLDKGSTFHFTLPIYDKTRDDLESDVAGQSKPKLAQEQRDQIAAAGMEQARSEIGTSAVQAAKNEIVEVTITRTGPVELVESDTAKANNTKKPAVEITQPEVVKTEPDTVQAEGDDTKTNSSEKSQADVVASQKPETKAEQGETPASKTTETKK